MGKYSKNRDLKRIIKEIDNQGLRQDKFAEKLGHSNGHINRILKGHNKLTDEMKQKMFELLNIK